MVKDLTSENKSLKKKLAQLESEESSGNETVDNYNRFFSIAKQFTHIDELTEDIVRTFIERIEIGEKIYLDSEEAKGDKRPYRQSIKIVYRFIGDTQNNSENEKSAENGENIAS